jgi:hypothetical protein
MHLSFLDGSIGIDNGELDVSLFYGHHGLMLRRWIPNGQPWKRISSTEHGVHV